MTTLPYVKILPFIAALVLVGPTFAQDAHHPAGAAQSSPPPAASQAQPAAAPTGMGGMSMPKGAMGTPGERSGMMMGGGMMGGGMMGMMPMMGMGGHVEGRIAFLRTEIKITDAQQKVWNDFAAALRNGSTQPKDTRAGMMMMSGGATPVAQLEQEEQRLVARLEATRLLKAALAPLYAALSEEQRKTFAELQTMHMGVPHMGMM
ncbi:MAG: Spy/CpxP family protein refolding chaperone [Proteobacteria bacterium]|nr:Spy/CpxP family protein refolding chaperone [Pseudomonadota bacterium]